MLTGLFWSLLGLMVALALLDASGNAWRRRQSWRQVQSWWPMESEPPQPSQPRPWAGWPASLQAAQDVAWPEGLPPTPAALRWRVQGAWRRKKYWFPAQIKGFYRWPEERWLWHADVTLALLVSQPTRLTFEPADFQVERWVLGWWPQPWSTGPRWTELGALINLGLRTWCPQAWADDPGEWTTTEVPGVFELVLRADPAMVWQIKGDAHGRWQYISGPSWQLELADWSEYLGGQVPTHWQLRRLTEQAHQLVFTGRFTDVVQGGVLRWW